MSLHIVRTPSRPAPVRRQSAYAARGGRVTLALIFAGVLAAGCGPRRVSVATQPRAVVMAAPNAGCGGTLAVSVVSARAGCQIDERVSGQRALLEAPCGDGPARAAFGTSIFEGTVQGGELDLSIETSFEFSDHCRWTTKQRISGPMSSGAFAYEYEESPDAGQTGCARACLADATVQLLR